MKFQKIIIFVFISALMTFTFGCKDDDNDKDEVLSFPISSIAEDMKKCAPDLSSATGSTLQTWIDGENGWSAFATYGVLKKHFDENSGSESIYSVVLQLDQMGEELGSIPEGDGSSTDGDWSVAWEDVSGNVTLQEIFASTVVSDFEKKVTFTNSSDSSTGIMYYKSQADDQKIFYYYSQPANNETGIVFATRDTTTGDLEVYVACHKAEGEIPAGPDHVDEEFRLYLYFTGNTVEKNFKFELKTDAAQGWAFFGGGSVAADDSMVAVRGTDEADSATYENDGDLLSDDSNASYYIIVSFGDMRDNTFDGGEYPKEGTAENLDGETDSAVGFITIADTNCLIGSVADWQAIVYPEEAGELALP